MALPREPWADCDVVATSGHYSLRSDAGFSAADEVGVDACDRKEKKTGLENIGVGFIEVLWKV
jgi:hypothetical protein